MTNQQKAENNEIDESEYNYNKEQGANFKDMNNEYYGYEESKNTEYYEGRYYENQAYEGGYYDNQGYDPSLYQSGNYDPNLYQSGNYDPNLYQRDNYNPNLYKSKPLYESSKQMMYDNSNYSSKDEPYYDMGNYSQYQTYPKINRESKRKAKQRICSNCSTTSTPSWRRGENGKSLLCNACGLYQKLHGRARPYTVTPNGRTKALKGGYEKTLCVSCNNLYPISEVKGGTNAHVCDNCMTHIKNSKELDYQYYRYGNYYNYYAKADVNIDNTLDVNNTIYENIQNDKTDEKD